MKRKRLSVEQIVAVLKQADVGVPVAGLIRRVRISEQTFHRWKKQFKGLGVDQVRTRWGRSLNPLSSTKTIVCPRLWAFF